MPEIITEADLQQAQNLISPKNKADIGLLKKIITERPKNAGADISDIAIKIAMIDITNSTHLSVQRNKVSLCELAEIIKGIQDIDARLEEGDPAVVEDIAHGTQGEDADGFNSFSFATKFCCYHNRFVYGKDDYSIFDNNVAGILPGYCSDGTTKHRIETWRTGIDYSSFNNCIWRVITENHLTEVPNVRVKLDGFLWLKGRTHNGGNE